MPAIRYLGIRGPRTEGQDGLQAISARCLNGVSARVDSGFAANALLANLLQAIVPLTVSLCVMYKTAETRRKASHRSKAT